MKRHKNILLLILFLFLYCRPHEMAGVVSITSLEPTIFFNEINGELMQLAYATLTNRTEMEDIKLSAEVSIAGKVSRQELGKIKSMEEKRFDIYIPDIPDNSVEGLKIYLYIEGYDRPVSVFEKNWKSQRKWKLFLVPYSHLDVGYSNTQEDVLKIQKLNIDGKIASDGSRVGALELIEQTETFPENARFKYTCEVSWPCVEFLKDPEISEERKRLFVEYARQGLIEVSGFYINHTNKFMSSEAMIRSTYFSAEWLRRKYGIEVRSAVINDVGDASSVVQTLQRAGIRYFHFGPNTIHFALPPLFYLQSPSSRESKILVWLTPNLAGYGENTDLGLRPPAPPDPTKPHDPNAPLPEYEEKIVEHLTWLQEQGIPLKGTSEVFDYQGFKRDYPYDAYLVMYYPAHAGDNGHQDLTPSLIAYDWNKKYAYPEMRISTLSEFYEYMEEKYADRIPVITGDFSGFWGEQIFFADVQIDPSKESQSRRFEKTISEGEKLSSLLFYLNLSAPYSAESVMDAWSKIILNNDHNPIPVPISGNKCPSNSSGICYRDDDPLDPSDDTTNDVYRWKQTRQSWSLGASRTADALLNDSLTTLASAIENTSTLPKILVFNPASWERTDVVTVQGLRTGENNFILRDSITGNEIPYQITGGDSESGYDIVFIAEDVPPVGYRTFYLELTNAPPVYSSDLLTGYEEGKPFIENEFYRLVVNAGSSSEKNGGIITLFDKELKRELVDVNADNGLNQFVVLSRSENIGNGTVLNIKGNLLNASGFSSTSANILENGPVRARIRITGTYNAEIRTPEMVNSAVSFLSSFLGKSIQIPSYTPVSVSQDIVLYRGMKLVEFVQNFGDENNPVPLQVLENAFAYPFNIPELKEIKIDYPYSRIDFGTADPYRIYSPLISGDEFAALPMNPDLINAYNMAFLWIQGIPPENMFQNYVDISGDDFGITFTSRDSGIILPSGYEIAPFPKMLRSHFYHICIGPTILGNIILGTPENLPYRFYSALTSHSGNWSFEDNYIGWHTASQFGTSYREPLRVSIISPANSPSVKIPDLQNLLSIEKANVIATVVKPAEDGNGFIVRLYETNGKETHTKIHTGLITQGYYPVLTTSVEKNLCKLSAENDSFAIDLAPGMLATLRLTRNISEDIPDCSEIQRLKQEGCGCNTSSGESSWTIFFIGLFLLRTIYRSKVAIKNQDSNGNYFI